MATITELLRLKKQNLPHLTVIAGNDIGQYELMKTKVLEAIGYDKADLTYSYFDLEVADFDQVFLDLESLPFFAEEKIVILDHFSDITTSKKNHLDEKAIKQLENYLESPMAETKLILLARGKLDGKRRLVKLLKREGTVFELNELKESELLSFFRQFAKENQIAISQERLHDLMVKSNGDFAELSKNLLFLKDYASGREVTQQDIETAIPKTLQDNLFDLTKFLLSGKTDAVQSLVQDLILQGEDEIKLLAIMINQFRLMLQVKLLQKKGYENQQLVSQLSELLGRRVNPYQIKYILQDSKDLSISSLKEVVALLIETDYKIKSGINEKAYHFAICLLTIEGIMSK